MGSVNLRHGVFLAPLHNVNENPNLLIHRDLELMQWLDKLGFNEAWIGEHHSAGFETIASPELFIAAAVERTKNIRFGTGVISLPYHNPLTVANRVIQLDHQSRGRVMFGFGPGLLVTDAEMLGIDPNTSRDRMAQALDVILRLLKGDTVTETTEWYTLKNARAHLVPYSPRLEIAVASAATPSGGRLAGKYGLSMLCVAATDARGGFNVLDVNWKHACDAAAENGNVMDRNNLRLMGPMHIAETREKARENVRFGLPRYLDYARALTPGRFGDINGKDPVDLLLQSGHIVIGTPDDAIAVLSKLQEKQGDFGCFLHQAHDWADWEATKKSYELYMRFVAPHFARANRNRDASYDELKANSVRLSEKAHTAAQKTFEKYAKEDEASASLAAAQQSGMIGASRKQ